MDILLKLFPLILLIVAVCVVVWRGLGRNPDDTNNRAKSGAPSDVQSLGGFD